jgi:hypothetical protein
MFGASGFRKVKDKLCPEFYKTTLMINSTSSAHLDKETISHPLDFGMVSDAHPWPLFFLLYVSKNHKQYGITLDKKTIWNYFPFISTCICVYLTS